METDWILDEIATGLQKLYLLSLDRTPAAELLAGTAQSWLEVLTTGRVWEQARDTKRIRQAFVTLATTRESWPAPRHFFDALPHVVVDLVAIEKEFRPAHPETVAKARAEMEAFFREVDAREAKAAAEPKPEREGPPIAAVEAELREHYASSGKMAAAGPDA